MKISSAEAAVTKEALINDRIALQESTVSLIYLLKICLEFVNWSILYQTQRTICVVNSFVERII